MSQRSSVVNDASAVASPVLDERSKQLRRLVLRALVAADKGHVGSALSLIEIFRVLYDHVARHDPARPTWEDRDRIVLSKGHGCLALYAILADQGYIPHEMLDRFCERNALLGGHPERALELGIEASTGALGHGLPFATGMALAHRRLGTGVRIFVVVGDGELNEGSNWEAIMMASKHQLSNLIVIVDHNRQQQGAPTDEVLPLGSLRAKFEAFGAEVSEADGHSPAELLKVFKRASAAQSGPPRVVVCHTVKGKGFAAAEHNASWHYRRGFEAELVKELTAAWAAESGRAS
jgi:transketolase